MRLWQKIFLPTLALMVLCTTLASALLLRSSRDALWEREGQRAVTQQQYLAGLLRAGVVSRRLQQGAIQLSREEAELAARQVLDQQAMDGYLTGLALLDEEEGAPFFSMRNELFHQLPSPPAGEPGATVYQLCPGGREGEWFLLCSMPVTLESRSYRLYAAYSVGSLQQRLDREAVNAVALCLGMSLTGAGLLLALVWFLLRPLAALDESARRVSDGHYDEQVAVRGRDELADLARDMNRMAAAVQERVEQLERVAEDRKIFIGNLAHEMKTPLTSILGFADLLHLQKEVPDAQRVEYARVISEEAKRLRSLSGKLLELITLGSASLDLAPASLKEVAEAVAVSLGPVMAQSGLTLTCDCFDLALDMDRELFKSLLYNLLDNGRKASERGGQMALAAREVDGQAEILVRDYGRGIPREELDKVCQPFYMVDKSRSRKAGGVGLGLALCREIVSVHGGTMDIDSRLGEGTLVTLRFPLSADQRGGKQLAEP